MVVDERHFLHALEDTIETGRAPADELLEAYHDDWGGDLTRIYKDFSY
jgi:glutamate--cysteine ligase